MERVLAGQSGEEFTTHIEQLREAMTFFTIEERSEDPASQESQDFMQALYTFINDKGANEEEFIAMLKAISASRHDPVAKDSVPRIEIQDERKTPQKGTEEQSEPSEGSEIEMRSLPGGPDDRDDEFERF